MTSVISHSIRHSKQRNAASLGFRLNPDNTLALTSPPWIREVEERINDLLNLADNWDGEGSQAPDTECAIQVLDFLLNVALHETPAPAITPMSGGGLLVEWHCRNRDLEIAFASDSSRTYFHISPDGVESEGDAEREEDLVTGWISELSARDARSQRES